MSLHLLVAFEPEFPEEELKPEQVEITFENDIPEIGKCKLVHGDGGKGWKMVFNQVCISFIPKLYVSKKSMFTHTGCAT